MVYQILRLIINLLSVVTLSKFSDNFSSLLNFPTSKDTFQRRFVLSNFDELFPTKTETFQLQTFQLKTFQFLVFFNCSFQLHVSHGCNPCLN